MQVSGELAISRSDDRSDAVAVVGMACRFPGAPGIAEFWKLLTDGRDAIGRDAGGRRRGMIEAPGDFDAAFFGMSPREAAETDPQQRLMLELGWEALEDAGIVPGSLRGEAVGVFVGAMHDDYATLLHRAGAPVGPHTATGLQRAMLANRLSYVLGTRGPSLAVDTAQSSSLVAVALAVESLRAGTSRVAVAGGVNLVLADEGTAAMERLGALSPDGRCHTFDARANGYVRGEGGAAVVLKPLADALADGDPVYCVVRGVAVGNDGGGPGLTAPDREGQEAVLRAACAQARVDPAEVRFVELHGTGTPVGDPVEAHALGAVHGSGRPADDPLLVGSVKTNIGHLEGAAGIAGLVKAALCLRERTLPGSLNFATPSPAIPLDQLRLKVQTAAAELPLAPGGAPLLAGVSSFGIGGTNCHVVLEHLPSRPTPAASVAASLPDVPPLLLSARSEGALRAQAVRLGEYVERVGADPRDVAYSLASTRTLFEHRAVVPCGGRGELVAALGGFAAGRVSGGVRSGRAVPGGVGVLFTGQGAQWVGMGRGLYAGGGVFAEVLDEVLSVVGEVGGWSLRDVMFGDVDAGSHGDSVLGGLLGRTEFAQPALFALEVALFRALEARGVEVSVVLGHSVGEVAAAYVAGVLSLGDAVRLVVARGGLMGGLPVGGGMWSVGASESVVRGVVEGLGEWVSVAAVNGPRSVVLSGDVGVLESVVASLVGDGVECRRLDVSHGFHSVLMEPVLGEFRGVVESLEFGRVRPGVVVVSGVSGGVVGSGELGDPGYWVRHAREAVRFADGVGVVRGLGVGTLVEVGPHGVLTGMAGECLEAGDDVVVVPAMRRGRAEREVFEAALATVFTRDAGLDATALHTGSTGRRIDLPTYPFQRRTHWSPALSRPVTADAGAGVTATDAVGHSVSPDPESTEGTSHRDTDDEADSASPEPMSPEDAVRLVRESTAAVLGHDDPGEVALDRTFTSQGMDSVTAVELCDLLKGASGLPLAATLVYDLPTPRAVAEHIVEAAGGPKDSVAGGPGVLSSAAVGVSDARGGSRDDDDPIAIVGVGCRLPGGVDSRAALWELLESGADAISSFPTDRGWDLDGLYDPEPGTPGKTYVREGGFLHSAAEFDAEFFGISPREATAMDPQQRLLLEASWEALEDAGVLPASLRGGDAGVFVGATAPEYGPRLHEGADGYEGYLLTGTTASVASGRIAYTLGTGGPALTVDTACSSSLVALHLAVQALRRGECGLALAGGATVMSGPGMFVEFSRQRGLAPDGRCMPFSADADGTAWSEGVAVLALERLSDARRAGHRVLGVVRGSAVNQDGASNGLTAPNRSAQEGVIRAALADAGLAPGDVDAVEAHGTGTALGDPIEASALLATYGRERVGDPLWLGSLKSNVGHTQAAAGAAGVVKMLLALEHGTLPRTLHADRPSTHVDWSSGTVALLAEARRWPRRSDRPRRAAVSSFGISGTNAHLIIEEAPEWVEDIDGVAAPDRGTADAAAPSPLLLSARSEGALRAQAVRLGEYVERVGADPRDVAYSLASTRTLFEHRAVVPCGGRGELVAALGGFAAGRVSGGVRSGRAVPGGVGVLFTGQGAQWVGMGRGLYAGGGVFAEVLDEVLSVVGEVGGWSLRDVMFGDVDAGSHGDSVLGGLLGRTEFAQPALFALEVALFRALEARGVEVSVVLGHSVGEVAAAYVAGVLSLGDAVRLVVARGGLMGGLPVGGGMWSVGASESVVRGVVEGLGEWVSVAAVNGPRSVVLSGDVGVLESVVASLVRDGVECRRLDVSHGFHSVLMEPVLGEFRGVVESLEFGRVRPGVVVVSGVSGGVVGSGELGDPGYWVRHAREAVRFADGVGVVRGLGVGTLVEVGPHGVLTGMAGECLEAGDDVVVVPAMRRGRAEREVFEAALATVFTRDAGLDATALHTGSTGRRIDLPTYPFQRDRYWLDPVRTAVTGVEPAGSPADARATEQGRSTTAGIRYRVAWQPAVVDRGNPGPAGHVLLLAPDEDTADSGLAPAIARELTVRGAEVHTVAVPVGTGREAAGDLLRAAGDGAARSTRVLWLAPAEPDTADAVALVQALGEAVPEAPLWITTREAAAVRPDETPSVGGAQLWGLGQVAALELGRRWGGLADLPGSASPAVLRTFVGALLAGGENQFAVRPSGVHVRRVVPAPVPVPASARTVATAPATAVGEDARNDTSDVVVPDDRWSSGTVLITGGTGALGAQVARRLARSGAARLLLVGRRGAAGPGVGELVEELTALGSEVAVEACDVADRDALAALLAGIPEERPLVAVLHAAGVLDDGVLDSLTSDRVEAVLRAKVTAARHLDELTADLPLDAFVLFSSIVGVWGNGGQAAYAAANAALDALAQRRRARGARAASIAWGPWAGAGMASGTAAKSFERDGVTALDPERALDVLDDVVGAGGTSATGTPAAGESSLLVADVDWETFVGRSVTRRTWSLFDGVSAARSARAAHAADDRAALTRGTRPGDGAPGGIGQDGGEGRPWLSVGPSPAERRRALLTLVRSEAAGILRHASADAVDPELAFRSAGFDSLTVLELRNRLTAATGLNLPNTLLFDHPTPLSLASHLHDELFGPDSEAEPAAAALTPVMADEREPIAIVGMACRYPGGVASPDDLWDLVAGDGHTLSPFPADRGWDVEGLYDPEPGVPGKSYVREGGFLRSAAEFDAEFFGISPREATAMDPQQRLLLETSWEALERAGIVPDSLRGTRTGVFSGISQQDYATQLGDAADTYGGHVLTGTLGSVISGRVAYALGLEGPALTVDTACSSSLVALHLAVQSLRRGECDLALAGGVTVMATPTVFVEFSRQRGLAVDGRCKAFAEGADGTAWAEGVGVLLVERLSDARRRGHRVLAVVRGSAVNQDGASNGLTAPSGPAQQRVIREALADAGLVPADVDVVEAHGTGTALGDPIEAGALLATYGRERVGDPLWLGSLKSNIGHAQAAAGVGGVIKVVQAMRHGSLPRTLHVDAPSSKVEWASGAVELLTETRSWPRRVERVRRAAVSAFGVSGTNAHVVLEEAPVEVSEERSEGLPDASAGGGASVPLSWVLSARSEGALRAQAVRLRECVERVGADPVDVAGSLVVSRASFGERAVVVGRGREELLAGLDVVAAGAPVGVSGGVSSGAGAVVRGSAVRGRGVGVLFTGQGAQWVGMGRGLYAGGGVFAEVLDEVLSVVGEVGGWSLRDVMFGDVDAGSHGDSVLGGLLGRTEFAQPALFALEVALFRALEARGVEVSVVLGHSVGEVAAAYVAGVLSLGDAVRLVVARGGLMGGLPVGGGMWSVGASESVVRGVVEGLGEWVSVAAVNGPRSVVLSGDVGVLESVVASLVRDGVECRRLDVSHGFHSVLMEPVLGEFRGVVESLEFGRVRPGVVVVSGVSGGVVGSGELGDPGYWVRHAREAVRFADGVGVVRGLGVGTLVEVGPHGVLTGMAGECLEAGDDVVVVPAMRRGRAEREVFEAALATVFTRDAGLDATALHTGSTGRRIDLPTYPFQHNRYWATGSVTGATGTSAAARFGLEWKGHPFLSGATPIAGSGALLLTGRVGLSAHPWLADHAISGTVLLPGTAIADLLLRAVEEVGAGGVEELTLHEPLLLPERGGLHVQVLVEAADEQGRRAVAVAARPEGPGRDGEEPEWTRHAEGVLTSTETAVPDMGWAAGAWPPPGAEPIDVEELYDAFAADGYGYGPAFTALSGVWRLGDELFAEVRRPAEGAGTTGDGFGVHPALFDAALHPWRAGGLLPDTGGTTWAPFSWQGIALHTTGAETLRVRLAPAAGGTESAFSVQAADPAGTPVLTLDALLLRPVTLGKADAPQPLYRVDWQPVGQGTEASGAQGWTVLGQAAAETVGQPAAHADLTALRTAVAAAGTPVPRLVVVSPVDTRLDEGPVVADAEARARAGDGWDDDPLRVALGRGLTLVREWVEDERLADSRLVVLTRGAVAAGPGDVPDLAGAALWGLLRSAQSEYPDRFTLIDVDDSPESRAALPRALGSAERQLALRTGDVLAPALVPMATRPAETTPATAVASATTQTQVTAPAPDDPAADAVFDPAGTVLITGGTGALGRRVASHLARRYGVRHMLLVSRRGPDAPEAGPLERELAGLGVTATFLACDLTDIEAVRKAVAAVPSDHPLTGVVHTAGVLDDGALTGLTRQRLDTVLRPKADAVRNLHEATLDRPLRAFVLFSAAAGLLGRPGQASYAAANAVLDALAGARRAAGLPAVSLAWGLWDEQTGMAGGLDEMALRVLRRDGIAAMPPEQGLELLDLALTGHRDGPAVLVPLLLDGAALRRTAKERGAATMSPLLRALLPAALRRSGGAGAPAAADRHGKEADPGAGRIAGMVALEAAERSAAVLELVTEQVAEVLGYASAAEIEPERPFREIGVDSLAAVELRNRLSRLVGLRLPTTLSFDHPTPKDMAQHIDGQLPRPAGASPADAALEGIGDLARAVALLGTGDARRAEVREQLVGLLAALDTPGRSGTAAPGVPSGADGAEPTVTDRLDEATDDEIFAFLDEQL
ncbi:hypothetical protein SAM40697_5117 [Streptomyces ambofaciens]|uniref:Type I polyketide synthase n=1 Tax=Streptomyces ambofaciens TaxID=1889 RepID=A0ABM6B5M8_STRAM|nr:type I polyketide synthase [Streptomyces ambofaciens]ANB09074.1 hypothetical protein SAM40697_5117 [Streptomyces ambofaciens]